MMTIPEIRKLCLLIAFDSCGQKTVEAILDRADDLFEWIFDGTAIIECDSEVTKKLDSIISKIGTMGENTNQALADLQAINTQLQKISTESATTLQKVTDLENAAANADTPASVLEAIAAVKAQVQIVDDLVPDAAPESPETPQ
jgi:hypothetical protein